MTFPDDRLARPVSDPDGRPAENTQDVIPPTERNEDPLRADVERGLAAEVASRPLTEAERKAAEHDVPLGERVYAPASERVPKDPVPGHREMIAHTDPHTPE